MKIRFEIYIYLNVIHHINRVKWKNIFISIYAEKGLDKIRQKNSHRICCSLTPSSAWVLIHFKTQWKTHLSHLGKKGEGEVFLNCGLKNLQYLHYWLSSNLNWHMVQQNFLSCYLILKYCNSTGTLLAKNAFPWLPFSCWQEIGFIQPPRSSLCLKG